MTRSTSPESSTCREEVDDLRADLEQRILDLASRVHSRDLMADLERRMQVADNAVSHVHVTLQGQIGAYNQAWQGLQTHCRQLDIETAFLDKDYQTARNDTSIRDGLAALRGSVDAFYAQNQSTPDQKKQTARKRVAKA